ncbi:MAG: DUF5320 domain-containing protein [Firmicutes bacterium]|nr:DUF5320 domain-containing protein [Bacillota bacterium]
MPRKDGTGPMKMGAMTGRGAGYCNREAGYTYPKEYARGFGCGLGLGRKNRIMCRRIEMPNSLGFNYSSNTNSLDKKTILTNRSKLLENELQQIKNQLSSMNEEV